jgi:hypothetical protein
MLFEIWVYFTLFPDYAATRTHLLLVGPKGSFKTSALRALLHLLFGRNWDVNVLDPKRQDAAIALFTSLPIVALDNLDGKISWLDNLLATAATGGHVPLRKLYETNELIQYPLNPFICATSRDPQNFARDDVADRTLMLNVERGDAFMGEGLLKTQVALSRAKAWGKILENIPPILSALREYKPQTVPNRMADFANFAFAVGPVLGYSSQSVEQALDGADRVKREFVMENSDLHQALEYWFDWSLLRQQKGFSGAKWIPSGELYKEMKTAWQGEDFPFKRTQDMGLAIANQRSELSHYFEIEDRGVGGGKRLYRISRVNNRDQKPKFQ